MLKALNEYTAVKTHNCISHCLGEEEQFAARDKYHCTIKTPLKTFVRKVTVTVMNWESSSPSEASNSLMLISEIKKQKAIKIILK